MQTSYKFWTYLFVFSFLLVKCGTPNNDKEIKKFPKTITVSGKPAKEIKIIANWADLVVIDTFLVVQKRKNSIITIYSTNTHKLLKEIGVKGSGPNEFNLPTLLKQVSYDKKNNSPIITLYDIVRRRFSKLNILNVIEEKKDAINQESIPQLDDFLMYAFYKDDSLLLATPETGGRFVISNNSTTKYIPFIPELSIPISDTRRKSVYRSFVAVNKEKNKFVAAPTLLNELNFFDLQGNYINSTIIGSRDDIEKNFKPISKKHVGFKPEAKKYISSIEQIDDKIYAFNKEKTFEEKKNPKVQVFDWDGNPIEEYILEYKGEISALAYDKIHHQFYAYCPNEKNYNIIIFPLKE